MEVVRHGGANWARGCAAADVSGALLAVAVRSSVVLLRAADGGFVGEVRQLGRGAPRALALAFAHAPALAHLLAVAYDDATWRVFDADTRRLVRSGGGAAGGAGGGGKRGGRRDVAAICFGADTPNLLFVALSCGEVDVYDLSESPSGEGGTRIQKTRTLRIADVVRSVKCVSSVRGSPAVLLVGGERAGDKNASTGVVAAIDVRDASVKSSLDHPAGSVDSLSVYLNSNLAYVAFVSSADGKPEGAALLNGGQLALVSGDASNKGLGKATSKSQRKKSNAPTSMVSWMSWPKADECFLVNSLVCGGLQLWRIGRDKPVLTLRTELVARSAHGRQVFAIVPLPCEDGASNFRFVTASMDRTLVGWVSAGSTLERAWTSSGCGGYVQAVDVYNVPATDEMLQAWLAVDNMTPSTYCGSLVASGFGDGSIAVDYSSDDQAHQPIMRRVLHYRLPPAPSGRSCAVVSVKFLHHSVGSALSVNSVAQHCALLVIFCTVDGQIGCIDVCATRTGSAPGSDAIALQKPKGPGISDSSFSAVRQGGRQQNSIVGRETATPLFVIALDDIGFLQCSRGGRVTKHIVEKRRSSISFKEMWAIDVLCDGNSMGSISCTSGDFCFSRCGVLCLGTNSGTLAVLFSEWTFEADDNRHSVPSFRTLSAQAFECGVSATARSEFGDECAVASDNGAVAVYKILPAGSGPSELLLQWHQRSIHTRRVMSLAWNPFVACDSHEPLYHRALLTCSEDALGKVLSSDSGESIAVLKGHAGRMLSCAWRSFDCVLTGGEDCSLREWTLGKVPKA